MFVWCNQGTMFVWCAGLNGGAVYDDEQMAKPIKKFIADFVRKQVITSVVSLLPSLL